MELLRIVWLCLAGALLLYIFVYLFIIRPASARRARAAAPPPPPPPPPVSREPVRAARSLEDTVTTERAPLAELRDGALVMASEQHIGARSSQQDAVRRDLYLGRAAAVICDGMGGMAGGERASALAADALFSALLEKAAEQDAERCMENAARRADMAVAELEDANGAPLDAGTTAVAVYIEGELLSWLSVGDSRIYLYRDGALSQLTRDHNYFLHLSELVEAGELDAESAMADRRGEALISYLGVGGPELVDTGSFRLLPGDRVLLASDGLFKPLSAETIGAMLEDCSESAALCVRALVAEAVRQGGRRQDNTSAVLIAHL